MSTPIKLINKSKMLKVKDVSKIFQKSHSWVYKNWKQIGGVKFLGSLVFPNENEIYQIVFRSYESSSSQITSNKRKKS